MPDISLWKACELLGVPPRVWMMRNPFKIYDFIEVSSRSGLKRDHSIVDLGCGKGHWTLLLAERCRQAVGIEPSSQSLRIARRFRRHSRAKERVKFLQSTLETANLRPESADRVYSFCVLEHITNLDRVLEEVYCLLKPVGELHISVDSLGNIQDPSLTEKHRRDHQVHQYFTPKSLRKQLEAARLEVIEIYPIMTGEIAQREFRKRIQGNYKHNLFGRLLLYRKFRQEDRLNRGRSGIMLIARARRPPSSHTNKVKNA
jgi:ubiquinone/menaquinone biosynthesis C-methylase UbiE